MLWGAEKLVPAEYWCPYGILCWEMYGIGLLCCMSTVKVYCNKSFIFFIFCTNVINNRKDIGILDQFLFGGGGGGGLERFLSWISLPSLTQIFFIFCTNVINNRKDIGILDQFLFGGVGGGEVSVLNISTITYTKIKWLCLNITCLFCPKMAAALLAPPPPPTPPHMPMKRRYIHLLMCRFLSGSIP